MKCALAIYKQTILPLFDYTGFMQMSLMVSVENMHNQANLLSLEQRRQKQVLLLLFMYKKKGILMLVEFI